MPVLTYTYLERTRYRHMLYSQTHVGRLRVPCLPLVPAPAGLHPAPARRPHRCPVRLPHQLLRGVHHAGGVRAGVRGGDAQGLLRRHQASGRPGGAGGVVMGSVASTGHEQCVGHVCHVDDTTGRRTLGGRLRSAAGLPVVWRFRVASPVLCSRRSGPGGLRHAVRASPMPLSFPCTTAP